jgi:hypothetical protein
MKFDQHCPAKKILQKEEILEGKQNVCSEK